MEQSIVDELSAALEKIDRPSSFCTSGSVTAILPGLEVDGFGSVSVPLSAREAKALIQHCEQAPYGKGTETLVDASVRRVWRLTPDHFKLANPDWPEFVDNITAKVQSQLGLDQKLQPHLYDLLLYEPGNFFLPHRDGEKLDRMVATMVVVLPSPHQGGELVVRHDGREETIDFSSTGSNVFQVHYAAFYADCEHEIRPVREGYRLCLVYNLTLARGKKGITAPKVTAHIEEVSGILRNWANEPTAMKLVITLDHQYTETGLSWDALKGADRAVADIVAEAAQRADCMAYLGLLTFWESGSGHSSGDDYGYHDRWHSNFDEDGDEEDGDEDEDEGSSEYEMDEVCESTLTLKNGRDRLGQPMPFEELSVDEEDLLDPEALRSVTPKEEFEGYTGNAGMTLERWYRHAAIILWPTRRYFNVVCNEDPHSGVVLLKEMVAEWKKASAKNAPALKESCTQLAAAILASWRENSFGQWVPKTEPSSLLDLLHALGDRELVNAFMTKVLAKDVSHDPAKALASVCGKYGWNTFAPALRELFKNTNAPSIMRNTRLLEHLGPASVQSVDGSQLCGQLAQELVAALQRIDTDKSITDWRLKHLNRDAVLPALVRALIAAHQPEMLDRLIRYTLADRKNYPLPLHLKAIDDLKKWLEKNASTAFDGLMHWLDVCREELEKLTAAEPREPTDFRRPAEIKCKCKLCAELNTFLADPTEKVHRIMTPQAGRSHLEQAIDRYECDLDTRTERTRPAHTLICTKNTKSYQHSLQKYHDDLKHLADIREVSAAVARTGAATALEKKPRSRKRSATRSRP